MPYYITRDQLNPTGIHSLAQLAAPPQDPFFFPIWCGQPLTPATLAAKPDPFEIDIEHTAPKIPSVWGGFDEPWYVDEAAKTALEHLESGRHGFIPISIIGKNVKGIGTPNYVLHVTEAIQAIVIEETRFVDGIGRKAYKQCSQLVKTGPIVLDASRIVGRHLWRGGIGKYGGGDDFAFDYFCSDELAERLQTLGDAQVRFHRCIVR